MKQTPISKKNKTKGKKIVVNDAPKVDISKNFFS
jgi:hypothetical protein